MVPQVKTPGSRSGEESRKIAAIFDVDDTLVQGNASRLYFNYFYRHGKVTRWRMLRIYMWTVLHRMNRLKEDKAFAQAVSFVVGWEDRETRDICARAFQAVILPRLSKKMRDVVEQHRSYGHLLLLSTSMPTVLAEQFKEFYNLDDMLCTEMEILNHHYTGRLLHMNYRAGKMDLLRDYARVHDLDLAHSYFYADSFSDRDAMELVGNPVAVNPDKKLKAHAKMNKWKLIKH